MSKFPWKPVQTVIDELLMAQHGQALRIKTLDVAQSKGVPTLEFLPREALTGSHSEDWGRISLYF